MRLVHKTLLVGGIVSCLFTAMMPMAQANVSIGVIAPRGELKTMKRWSDFGKYMTEKLGEKVSIKPLSPKKLIPAVKSGEVNFVLSNPTQAVILQEVHGAIPLATLNTNSGSQLAGVILAKKGSGISKAEDLKGKKVMALKFRRAAGAYTFQTYHLHQKGIDPHKDFAMFKEGKKQDDLVLAVKAGVIDAAFVRSGLVENMAKEGKVSLDDFTIVDQRDGDGLAALHTTQLYPEWYLSAAKGTDSALADKVKQASLALQPGDAAAQTAKIQGFVAPVPMDSMKEALKALKIQPYDK